MLESAIERKFVNAVEKAGGLAYKIISPNRRGVPDRLVLYPIPDEHRAIVAKYVRFYEMKQENGRATPLQRYERNLLNRMGFFTELKRDAEI